MSTVTIAVQAALTTNGDARTASTSVTLDTYDITHGRQSIGNTYEDAAWFAAGAVATFIYNDGEVDISIRCELTHYTTNRYVFYTVPPGALFSVPYMHMTDNGQPARSASLAARSESGTCEIDYCILL